MPRRTQSRNVPHIQPLDPRLLFAVSATQPLPNFDVTTTQTVDLSAYFAGTAASSEVAVYNTSLGSLPVALTPSITPTTVDNFEKYVTAGRYDGSFFHRQVRGQLDVLQGGGFLARKSEDFQIGSVITFPTIPNEASIPNTFGTLSMARSSALDSASSQWFFNTADNSDVLTNIPTDQRGYAVFGRVVGDKGLNTLQSWADTPKIAQGDPSNSNSPFNELPVLNYKTGDQIDVEKNLFFVNSITIDDTAGFAAISSNPAAVTARVSGSTLTLTRIAPGDATITITAFDDTAINGPTTLGNALTATFATTATTPASSLTTTVAASPSPAPILPGEKASFKEVVTLASAGELKGKATVALGLRNTASSTSDFIALTSTTKNLNFKAAGSTKLNLNSNKAVDLVTPGTYQVLVRTTDPAGIVTETDTGTTLTVQTPDIDLSAVYGPVASTAKSGKKFSTTLIVTNNGTSTAKGLLTYLSGSSTGSGAASYSKNINLKPGAKTILKVTFLPGNPGETYSLVALIDPDNLFLDKNLANNTTTSPNTITVS